MFCCIKYDLKGREAAKFLKFGISFKNRSVAKCTDPFHMSMSRISMSMSRCPEKRTSFVLFLKIPFVLFRDIGTSPNPICPDRDKICPLKKPMIAITFARFWSPGIRVCFHRSLHSCTRPGAERTLRKRKLRA